MLIDIVKIWIVKIIPKAVLSSWEGLFIVASVTIKNNLPLQNFLDTRKNLEIRKFWIVIFHRDGTRQVKEMCLSRNWLTRIFPWLWNHSEGKLFLALKPSVMEWLPHHSHRCDWYYIITRWTHLLIKIQLKTIPNSNLTLVHVLTGFWRYVICTYILQGLLEMVMYQILLNGDVLSQFTRTCSTITVYSCRLNKTNNLFQFQACSF